MSWSWSECHRARGGSGVVCCLSWTEVGVCCVFFLNFPSRWTWGGWTADLKCAAISTDFARQVSLCWMVCVTLCVCVSSSRVFTACVVLDGWQSTEMTFWQRFHWTPQKKSAKAAKEKEGKQLFFFMIMRMWKEESFELFFFPNKNCGVGGAFVFAMPSPPKNIPVRARPQFLRYTTSLVEVLIALAMFLSGQTFIDICIHNLLQHLGFEVIEVT